jgi:hypothetical protein
MGNIEERYRLVPEGYDLGWVIERVGELAKVGPEEIMERGKEKRKGEARSMERFGKIAIAFPVSRFNDIILYRALRSHW